MNVRELIEKLQTLNPDDVVMVTSDHAEIDYFWGDAVAVTEVVKVSDVRVDAVQRKIYLT